MPVALEEPRARPEKRDETVANPAKSWADAIPPEEADADQRAARTISAARFWEQAALGGRGWRFRDWPHARAWREADEWLCHHREADARDGKWEWAFPIPLPARA
jgi:hypothetical protein